MMHVVESLPALVVLDKMYYSCCCAGLNVVNNNNNNNNRIEQQKRSKGLLFFDETFLAHQKTLLIFSRTLISKRALTLLFQKRVVVCLLSLSFPSLLLLLCAWCKDIYRERRTGKFGTDERNRSDRSFIFLLKRFAFAKYLLFIARKETNDDGFHVGQR